MVAHYGWGMQGILKACRVLGHKLENLSMQDAASLVARLKYPEPQVTNGTWETLVSNRTSHIAKIAMSTRNNSNYRDTECQRVQ